MQEKYGEYTLRFNEGKKRFEAELEGRLILHSKDLKKLKQQIDKTYVRMKKDTSVGKSVITLEYVKNKTYEKYILRGLFVGELPLDSTVKTRRYAVRWENGKLSIYDRWSSRPITDNTKNREIFNRVVDISKKEEQVTVKIHQLYEEENLLHTASNKDRELLRTMKLNYDVDSLHSR